MIQMLLLSTTLCFPWFGLTTQDEKELDDTAMKKLQDFGSLVGKWEGAGKSDDVKGWDETASCAWKFSKSGKVSLYLYFNKKDEDKKGLIVDEGMLTYDTKKEEFVFKAYPAGKDDVIEFRGKPKTPNNLVLDRVENADDNLDRIDLKMLSDGDRLVYSFHRRIGTSSVYRPYAQSALDREGESLAGTAGKSGNECIVTGGAASITVTFQGKTYYVCCTGCRAVFLDNPQKWIDRKKE